jgi:hypothetical protein
MTNATPQDVAQWMLSEVRRRRRLYQSWAAAQIGNKFGQEFIYRNKNRHWAIDNRVLTAFRKLYGDTVVWNSGPKYWELKQMRGQTSPGPH